MNTVVSTVLARDNFSDLINQTIYGKKRTILTRRGKNVVAVIPVEDLELLERLEDELDIQDAKKALAEAKEKGTISLSELKRELNL